MTAPAAALLDEPRWKTIMRRLIVVGVIAVIIGGFWLAMSRTQTGDQNPVRTGASTIAQVLSPRDGDQVLNQNAQISIQVDLRYNATLTVIDPTGGVTPIPDDQVNKLPQAGATQLLFTPGEGKAVAALRAGRNCVRADIYRIDGTQEVINPVTWCFQIV